MSVWVIAAFDLICIWALLTLRCCAWTMVTPTSVSTSPFLRSSGISSAGAPAARTQSRQASLTPAALRSQPNTLSIDWSFSGSAVAFCSSTCVSASSTEASSSMVSPKRKLSPCVSPRSRHVKGTIRRRLRESSRASIAAAFETPPGPSSSAAPAALFFDRAFSDGTAPPPFGMRRLPSGSSAAAAAAAPAPSDFSSAAPPSATTAGVSESAGAGGALATGSPLASISPAPPPVLPGAMASPRKPRRSERYLRASESMASTDTSVRDGSSEVMAVRRACDSSSSRGFTVSCLPA
mmetsp:Transcript_34099/g.78790  ORF Transcript_34099/g.78790 Transcript_34099/m.78790 type:complete len:294 (-) Transcript_34099:201-1082(-)